jgi:hypothetical protein
MKFGRKKKRKKSGKKIGEIWKIKLGKKTKKLERNISEQFKNKIWEFGQYKVVPGR